MNPDAAREQAREILGERRFTGTEPPRPFERPLRWLGERFDGLLGGLDGVLPGGSAVVWVLLAAVVLALALLVARQTIRGRSADATGAGGHAIDTAVDPHALEREADAAARAGDHEAAVRLRFRAGLARLAAADVLDPRPGLTTGDVASVLRSPAFDALGADFDAIAYGRRPAGAPDDDAARRGWRDVLAAAR